MAITTRAGKGAALTNAELDTNFTELNSGKEPTIAAGTTAQYYRGDKSWQALDKAAVGLGNVDNTSDAAKPVSAATQTALDGKVSKSGDTLSGAYVIESTNDHTLTLRKQGIAGTAGTANSGWNYIRFQDSEGDVQGYIGISSIGDFILSNSINGVARVDGILEANEARFTHPTAIKLPAGTVAQRPGTPVAGMIRYNSDAVSFEGYNGSAWDSVGGGAKGAASNPVFYENDTNVTGSYTITTGKNAMSAGPITVNNGATVTVPNGSVWTIV